jgi:hypothetical protein
MPLYVSGFVIFGAGHCKGIENKHNADELRNPGSASKGFSG